VLDTVLGPLENAVSWIMIVFHTLLTPVFGYNSGLTWTLSIVGLVIVIRILLIPLFVKQIRASRGLQLLQPDMQAIQKKYKGRSDPESRQKQQAEMMALYKKHGTNPFSSCLPLLAQAPIFFALFRVLNGIAQGDALGVLSQRQMESARGAEFLGAEISITFLNADQGGASAGNIRIVTAVLIVLMSLTTFTTQRQLMRKNMPESAMSGPFAQQQKIMLYLFPVIFAVSGINFPIGVLLYWLTTNLWSMGQQFYVIRRSPAPGSKAEAELMARRAAKGKSTGATGTAGGAGATGDGVAGVSLDKAPPRQRQQPRKQPPRKQARSKRQPGGRQPAPRPKTEKP
jgi:YidC/Oxa1 family membrane protein insertase